jgi:hypothetical protein
MKREIGGEEVCEGEGEGVGVWGGGREVVEDCVVGVVEVGEGDCGGGEVDGVDMNWIVVLGGGGGRVVVRGVEEGGEQEEGDATCAGADV